MPSPALPGRRRRLLAVGLVAVAVALVLVSPHFGRAEPDHNYRPDLPPDALATGCYPLPGGVSLDFPYQVRWDGEPAVADGSRRELRGQYDVLGREEVAQRLLSTFAAVGFTRAPSEGDGWTLLERGREYVRVRVEEIPDTSAATLVRGEFVLDLPVVARSSAAAVCDQRTSTKRWGSLDSWWESWTSGLEPAAKDAGP